MKNKHRKYKEKLNKKDKDYGNVIISDKYDKHDNLIFKIKINKKEIEIPYFMIANIIEDSKVKIK